MVAASIARDAYDRRYSVGLLVNSTVPDADRAIRIAPGQRAEQFIRVLEALGVVTPFVLEPLAAMLDREEHRLSVGTTRRRRHGDDARGAGGDAACGCAAAGSRSLVLSTSGETWPELLEAVPRARRLARAGRLERRCARGGRAMTVRAARTPLAIALDVIWGYALAALHRRRAVEGRGRRAIARGGGGRSGGIVRTLARARRDGPRRSIDAARGRGRKRAGDVRDPALRIRRIDRCRGISDGCARWSPRRRRASTSIAACSAAASSSSACGCAASRAGSSRWNTTTCSGRRHSGSSSC